MSPFKYKRMRSLKKYNKKKYSTKRKSRKSKKSQSAAKRRSRKRKSRKRSKKSKRFSRFGNSNLTKAVLNIKLIDNIMNNIKNNKDFLSTKNICKLVKIIISEDFIDQLNKMPKQNGSAPPGMSDNKTDIIIKFIDDLKNMYRAEYNTNIIKLTNLVGQIKRIDNS